MMIFLPHYVWAENKKNLELIRNLREEITTFYFCVPGSLSLYPPLYSKKGGHSETLLNACNAHSNSADLLLSNNASDWLSGDFDKKNQ